MSTSEDLESQVSSLNSRLKALEMKVSNLTLTQEMDKKQLEEVQQLSEKVAALQEQKFAELQENLKEQKKLLGEMRIHLQNLQNSRVNHKDVLVRHENMTKKLIELVNDISDKQHEMEMKKKMMSDERAKRFSTFEGQGRRVRGEELYDLPSGRQSGRKGGARGQGRSHSQHRRIESFPIEKQRRRSSSKRRSNDF